MRGIDGIESEDERKSILGPGSSLHHKLPITRSGECISPVRRVRPGAGSPRLTKPRSPTLEARRGSPHHVECTPKLRQRKLEKWGHACQSPPPLRPCATLRAYRPPSVRMYMRASSISQFTAPTWLKATLPLRSRMIVLGKAFGPRS